MVILPSFLLYDTHLTKNVFISRVHVIKHFLCWIQIYTCTRDLLSDRHYSFIYSFQPVMPLLAGGLHSCFHTSSMAHRSCATRVHILPALSSMSSLHLRLGLPFVLLPSLGVHSIVFPGPLVAVHSSKMSRPLAFHVLYFFDDILPSLASLILLLYS